MPVKVEMPRLSDTMQAGTVVKWNVKEGQKIRSGDVIADIETDKATMELQSFDDGTVAAMTVSEGQNVPIGTVIMLLATGNEDPAQVKAGGAAAPKAAAPAKANASPAANQAAEATPAKVVSTGTQAAPTMAMEPATNGQRAPSRHFASPLARKIASEAGVDLASVHGTGPGGRIVRKDVEALVGGGAPAAEQAAPERVAKAVVSPAASALTGKKVALSNMRRIIATRLVESKQSIPHYQVSMDVDMDPLLNLRKQLNEQLDSQGVKLSVNDFIVRASALAMHQHPFVNSRWSEDASGPAIELLADVNIGVAIALPEERGGGLVVATIRSADQIGLRQISALSKQLADKARTKGLTPQEMSDATFTISNLGMFGVSTFNAIINPPNVAILALGGAIERAVVKDGQVVPGHVMSATISCDHRVVDGAMAAQYLNTVKSLLEKPATLLV